MWLSKQENPQNNDSKAKAKLPFKSFGKSKFKEGDQGIQNPISEPLLVINGRLALNCPNRGISETLFTEIREHECINHTSEQNIYKWDIRKRVISFSSWNTRIFKENTDHGSIIGFRSYIFKNTQTLYADQMFVLKTKKVRIFKKKKKRVKIKH